MKRAIRAPWTILIIRPHVQRAVGLFPCPSGEDYSSLNASFAPLSLMFLELLLPFQRIRDDGGEIVETRLPAQHAAGACTIGNNLRGVAGAPWRALDEEVDVGNALDGIDDLKHRKAAAIAAIERERGSAAAQIAQRVGMRAHEV